MKQDRQAKIKLLIATGIFPPDIGGPATYVMTLLKELPEHGFDVKVVTYSDIPDIPEIPNSKIQDASKFQIKNELSENQNSVYRISRKSGLLTRYLKYFLQVFKLLKWADLAYIQGPVSEGIPAWLACRLRGRKYILKVVGDYAWESYSNRRSIKHALSEAEGSKDHKVKDEQFISPDDFQQMRFDSKTELMRFFERAVARGAEKIITPSQYLKTIIKSWGIAENKIVVVYNAAPKVEIGLSRQEARNGLGIAGDIILSAGRMVPWKGFDVLIDLMPELLKVNPDFKLIIIGDGPEYDNLKFKILYPPRRENSKLTDSIIMTGSISKESVYKYMKAADMFVLNTGYEGLSHVIIEALQVGLPVITTNIGGNPELIEDGKSGVLVEYNNKEQIKNSILKIKNNPGLAQDFYEYNKTKLQDFTKERMIQGIIKEFNIFDN